ncbi:ankyrin repeat domain-containing protein [Halomonas denitrificans]|nr:ankyrin repeat domain-containing protein [Halomonas denitrificans]
MNAEFPFPTPIEVIRIICQACGLPTTQLKDVAYTRVVAPEKVHDILDGSLLSQLKGLFGQDGSSSLEVEIKRTLDEYRQLVGSVNSSGLHRQQILPILIESWFLPRIYKALKCLADLTQGPHLATLLQTQKGSGKALETTLNWLLKHEKHWTAFEEQCSREQKLKLGTWKSGKHRPEFQSLSLLEQWGNRSHEIEWPRVKGMLLLARIIDYLSGLNPQAVEELRVISMGAQPRSDLEGQLGNLLQLDTSLCQFQTEFRRIKALLAPTRGKLEGDMATVESDMDRLNAVWLSLSKPKEVACQVLWLRARWCVARGDLLEANQMYELAFKDSLYRTGEGAIELIAEALAVAAIQPRADRVFLKHLKFALHTFTEEGVLKTRSSELVDGDIQMWKNSFSHVFPVDGVFPEFMEEMSSDELRPWIACDPSLKPDLSRPNKKIYTGSDKKKRIQQLTWFCLVEDYESVEALVNAGARVDVSSPVGETPLLMALEAMNVGAIPYRSLDRRFFDMIMEHSGCDKGINSSTHKKKLLPIICAVESGRLDVVRKVLDLGADPNCRGLADDQTALNVCLKRIGQLKDPEGFKQRQLDILISPYVLDSLRRETQGMFGATLAQQQVALERMNRDPLYQKIVFMALDLQMERIQEHMSLPEMYSIARLLIERGADPNAVHRSPVDGYTPLMLAAELDERELFELMLCKGGDPKLTFFCPRQRRHADCWSIASNWVSKEVAQVLEWVEPNLH